MPPATRDRAPTRNSRSHVSAAGEKIWAIRAGRHLSKLHGHPIPATKELFLFRNPDPPVELSWALQGPAMRDQTGADYERSDIDPGLVGWIAAGLGLFVLVVPLLIPLAFPQIDGNASAGRTAGRASGCPCAGSRAVQ